MPRLSPHLDRRAHARPLLKIPDASALLLPRRVAHHIQNSLNAHVDGGKAEAYYGEEAARNLELAGGKSRLYTLHDASHLLRGGRLRRNPGAPLRWRENVRKAGWKLGVR